MITRAGICRALDSLGLREGDCVMMHSSLSALGYMEGGADTVVDALLDAVGPTGTLLVPVFRDSVWVDLANSRWLETISLGFCRGRT